MDSNVFVVLDTEITKELREEGYAREFTSKVQNLRKDSGFELTDRIEIYFEADSEIKNALDNFKDAIKKETLADSLSYKEMDAEEFDLNGIIAKIQAAKKQR